MPAWTVRGAPRWMRQRDDACTADAARRGLPVADRAVRRCIAASCGPNSGSGVCVSGWRSLPSRMPGRPWWTHVTTTSCHRRRQRQARAARAVHAHYCVRSDAAGAIPTAMVARAADRAARCQAYCRVGPDPAGIVGIGCGPACLARTGPLLLSLVRAPPAEHAVRAVSRMHWRCWCERCASASRSARACATWRPKARIRPAASSPWWLTRSRSELRWRRPCMAWPERNKLPEYGFFATALALQSETGGTVSDTLERLAEVIRKRVALREPCARAGIGGAHQYRHPRGSAGVHWRRAGCAQSGLISARCCWSRRDARYLTAAILSLTIGVVDDAHHRDRAVCHEPAGARAARADGSDRSSWPAWS